MCDQRKQLEVRRQSWYKLGSLQMDMEDFSWIRWVGSDALFNWLVTHDNVFETLKSS